MGNQRELLESTDIVSGSDMVTAMRAGSGEWMVVVDGDREPPRELAARLVEIGRVRDVDLVIGTRSPAASAANTVAKTVFPRRLSRPRHPTSGLFAVRRDAIELDRMRATTSGVVMMMLLVSHPRLRIAEVLCPDLAERGVGPAFLRALLRLRFSVLVQQVVRSASAAPRDWVLRAVGFGLIGLSGLVVNTAVLWVLHLQVFDVHYLLAAVLATEASTAWLFLLGETTLYRRDKPGTVTSRGLRFALLNHTALLVRLPLLALMVDGLGVNVLVSNAVTLCLLFLARFLIADSAIYGRGAPPANEVPPEPIRIVVDLLPPAPAHRTNGDTLARYLPFRYDIPGLATIGSQVELPELEYFRSQRLGNHTEIQIRVGSVGAGRPLPRAVFTDVAEEHVVGYREHLGRLGANFSVDLGDPICVVVSHALSRSPHVVYTNILEALLRFVAVSRGMMLLHSACVELNGVGVLISARTDTGKTGTVLRLVREQNASFLSDDMTVLYPDCRVSAFPKPLTISHHTLHAVRSDELTRRERRKLLWQSRLHSREGRRFALTLSRHNLPIMGVNALTQRLVPPPKYAVDRLLPCEIIPESKAAELFVIERGEPRLDTLSEDESMAILLANTEDAYQFPPFRLMAPSIVIGEDDHDELRRKERNILQSAISHLRAHRVSTPDYGWADRIPSILDDGAWRARST